MKARERSTKSGRENKVALTWLHGGHHTAPQYKYTGLPVCFASAKARSTSASVEATCHAMPDFASGALASDALESASPIRMAQAAAMDDAFMLFTTDSLESDSHVIE